MGLFNFGKTSEEVEMLRLEKEDKKRIKREEKAAKQKIIDDRLAAFEQDSDIENIILIDSKKGQFRIKSYAVSANIYDIEKITGYEIVENGNTVSSGGLGRAAIGALAFGGVGAIVGAATGRKKTKAVVDSLKIKITMNDLEVPVIYVDLITSKTKVESWVYRSAISKADNILASLDIIVKQYQQSDSIGSPVPSPTDEIRKFKALLDDGIISQEEFDAKKAELLNL